MDPPPSSLPPHPVVYDATQGIRSLFFEISEQLGHSLHPFIIHDEKLSESVSLMGLGKRVTQLNNLLDPFLINAQLSILEGRAIHQEFIQFLLSSVRKVADTIKLYRAYTKATVKADRGETKEAKRIFRVLEEKLGVIKRESCCLENQIFLERFNEPFQSIEHKFLSQDLFRLFHPLKHMTPNFDCDLEFVMQILAKHKSIELPDSNRLRALAQRLMELLAIPNEEIPSALKDLERLFVFKNQAKEIFWQTVRSKVGRLRELLQTFHPQLPFFQKKLFLKKLILILANKREAIIAPGFLLTKVGHEGQNVLLEVFKSESILYFRSENPTLEQIISTLKEKCSQIELDLKQEEEIQIALNDFESRFEIQLACQPPHFKPLKDVLKKLDISSDEFNTEVDLIGGVINLIKKEEELHESHFDNLALQIAKWGSTLMQFERLYPLFGEYQKVVQSILNDLSDRIPNDKIATFKEIIKMHLTQSATGRVQDLSLENQYRLYADLLSALNNPFDYSVNFYSYHPQLVSVNQEAASTLERIENLSLLVVRELEQTPPPSDIKNICRALLSRIRKDPFLHPLVLLRIYNIHPKWIELLKQITEENLYADFQRENSSVKLERMRKLRQLAIARVDPATPPIEIIGAGPAGLIRAIVVALKGGRPHIFEIEKAEPKERRSNVIVLGSHPDFDLDIHLLRFLGVLEKLEEEKKIGSLESYPTMMIKDLEDALKGCLKSILQLPEEEIFTYEHFLMGVKKESANVYFHFGKKEEASNRQSSRLDDLDSTLSHTILKNPPLILLTEGAAERAQTTQLLGLNRVVLSLNSRIRIQVFERTAEGPSLDEIPGRMLNFVVGLKEKGSLLIQSQQSSFHELQLLQARLLFSVPSRDYLIQGLSPEQEAYVNKLMKKIASRSFIIQQLQNSHPPAFPLLQKLIDEKSAMEKALETFNREQATQGRRVFDLNPFASYRYSSTHYVTITMRRLDRLVQFIGNTLLLPGGDVMQEVDPASGSGAQTAIHSAPILYQLLTDIEQHRGHTLTDLLKYTLALTRSMESALEQGFEKRGFYKKETGTIQRHLDTTQKFTKEEGQNLDKLLLKEKDQTPLEWQDFKFLVDFILKLQALPHSPLFVIKERLIHLLIRNQDTFLAQPEHLFDQRERMFQVPLLIETLSILNEPSLQRIIDSLKKMTEIIFSE